MWLWVISFPSVNCAHCLSTEQWESTFHPVSVVPATQAMSDLELRLRFVCWAFCCKDALLKETTDAEKAVLEREGNVHFPSYSQFFLGLLSWSAVNWDKLHVGGWASCKFGTLAPPICVVLGIGIGVCFKSSIVLRGWFRWTVKLIARCSLCIGNVACACIFYHVLDLCKCLSFPAPILDSALVAGVEG